MSFFKRKKKRMLEGPEVVSKAERENFIRNYLENIKKQGEKSVSANRIGNQGYALQNQGRLNEAWLCHEKAIKLHKDIADRKGEAIDLGNFGAIEFMRGNLKNAEAYFNQSLTIHLEIGNIEGEADQQNNLAIVERMTGRFKSALNHHRLALGIYQRLGLEKELAGAYSNMGTVYRKFNYSPSIYLFPGDVSHPFRCPACGSAEYLGFKEYVNEVGTFALSPDPMRLTHQRYVKLTCSECLYTYHIRPEGLWYEWALPPAALILVSPSPKNSNFSAPLNARDFLRKMDSEQGFGRIEPLTPTEIKSLPGSEISPEFETLEDKSVLRYPKPEFNLLLRASWPVAIARRQDERIIELEQYKRYTYLTLNPRLTNSNIILLTGAGFSVPLGFPAMKGFFQGLPESVQSSLKQMFVQHSQIRDVWLNDVEILTDLLLRLQRIALLSPTLDDFESHIYNLPQRLESIFVLREQHAGNWISYPPLAHCVVPEELYKNTKTDHYQMVRKLIYEVFSNLLLKCYHSTLSNQKTVFQEYRFFLSALSKYNRGPVPLFTTNFDRAVEQIYQEAGYSSRIATGAWRNIWPRPRIDLIDQNEIVKRQRIPYSCMTINHHAYEAVKQEDISIFHLHGCSNWFVDLKTGNTIEINAPNPQSLGRLLGEIWEGPSSWQPACIVPATVKDHYTISPPFNIGYDYFAESLKRARVAVIIGQSLRDETLKEMIFWSTKVNDRLRYVVVDKDTGANEESYLKKTLHDCIPDSRLACYFGAGFPDSAKKILELCANLLHNGI